MEIPLRKMKVNQRGKIKSVTAKGELGRRIRDMGLIAGTDFVVIGRAPLYDPVAVKMNGFTLTLRNSEADYITCEVDDYFSDSGDAGCDCES
jgi:ferrous iron transport protein A